MYIYLYKHWLTEVINILFMFMAYVYTAPNPFLTTEELLRHFTIYFSNKLCHHPVFCMCVLCMRQQQEKWFFVYVNFLFISIFLDCLFL